MLWLWWRLTKQQQNNSTKSGEGVPSPHHIDYDGGVTLYDCSRRHKQPVPLDPKRYGALILASKKAVWTEDGMEFSFLGVEHNNNYYKCKIAVINIEEQGKTTQLCTQWSSKLWITVFRLNKTKSINFFIPPKYTIVRSKLPTKSIFFLIG